jgi:hypothetical protein
MRLHDPSLDAAQRADIEQFAAWILSIGDGMIPAEIKGEEHEPSWIAIPEDLLIHTDGDKIAALVVEVFPNFIMRYKNPEYLAARAIVCPCPNNQGVDAINDYIVNLVPGDSVLYISCDKLSKSSEHIPDFDILYPTEFLNSITVNSFPNNKLVLKKVSLLCCFRTLIKPSVFVMAQGYL